MPPDPPFIKVNVDAAEVGPSEWGLGAVYRDENGNVLAVACWITKDIAKARIVEATSMEKAMETARDLCLFVLKVASDCLELVKAARDKDMNVIHLDILSREIVSVNAYFKKWKCSHVGRKGNMIAHTLAKSAKMLGEHIWVEVILM